MSELDLGLKIGARRLFWSMGLSTRLDVQLRGFTPPAAEGRGRGRVPEGFTDLDVLGISVANGYNISASIADCKTSRKDSTSRMFWVRGVADLFGADHAYLVREHEVSDAARQLSGRLAITVLTTEDLNRVQGFYSTALPDPSSPLSVLFDRKDVASHLAAFNMLDGRLKQLLDYRQFDFWVFEQHRNPVQLVAHLAGAARRMEAANPVHAALFLDLSWLYLLSMIRVTEHVRGAYLRDPDRGVQEYLFGGPTALREKQETARLLRSVAPPDVGRLDHLPAYYGSLRELVTRLLRRPAQMQPALRYLEVAGALAAARRPARLPEVLGDQGFDPIAAKLAADVCGFLVAVADLEAGFRLRARSYLLGEPLTAGGTTSSTAGRARADLAEPTTSGALSRREREGVETARDASDTTTGTETETSASEDAAVDRHLGEGESWREDAQAGGDLPAGPVQPTLDSVPLHGERGPADRDV